MGRFGPVEARVSEKMPTTKNCQSPMFEGFCCYSKLPKNTRDNTDVCRLSAPKEKQPRNTVPEVILRLMVQKSGKITS